MSTGPASRIAPVYAATVLASVTESQGATLQESHPRQFSTGLFGSAILKADEGDEAMPRIDFSHLSPQERLELAEDLLDSLKDADIPLTAGMKAELDRRNSTFSETSAQAVPWATVRARLRLRGT